MFFYCTTLYHYWKQERPASQQKAFPDKEYFWCLIFIQNIDRKSLSHNLYTFHHLSRHCHQSKLEIFLKSSVLVFQITVNSVSRDNLCWAPTFTWVGGKKLLLLAQKTAFCILHFTFCLFLHFASWISNSYSTFKILHSAFYIIHTRTYRVFFLTGPPLNLGK